jgi:hypothetical protein
MSALRVFPLPVGPFHIKRHGAASWLVDLRGHDVAEIGFDEFRGRGTLRVDDEVDEHEALLDAEYAFAQRVSVALNNSTPTRELRIVFDGPPSHESGRFVEVEDEHGHGVNAGEWRERPDGLWELVILRSVR